MTNPGGNTDETPGPEHGGAPFPPPAGYPPPPAYPNAPSWPGVTPQYPEFPAPQYQTPPYQTPQYPGSEYPGGEYPAVDYPAGAGYPPPPYQVPHGGPPHAAPTTGSNNALAVASLVTSLLGIGVMAFCCFLGWVVGPLLSLSGLVLGITGLTQSSRDGSGGRGLAVAGIVLGGVGLLAAVALLVLVGAAGMNTT